MNNKISKLKLLIILCSVFILLLIIITRKYLSNSKLVPIEVKQITKIVIYGDSRSNADIHRKIVSLIDKTVPAAVFNVGDLVDEPHNISEWAAVNQIIKPLQDKYSFFVAAGNHEAESKEYYENFILPGNEKWYSWDKGNAHFLVLNTNLDLSIGSEQYKWIQQDLEVVSKSKFIIVITHHPFLSVGPHMVEQNTFTDDLENLFEKYNVDIVFSGHEHNYERFFYNNIYYIITGGGGAPLYDKLSDNQYLNKFVKANNYCLLTISDSEIYVQVFDEKNQEIDKFFIK